MRKDPGGSGRDREMHMAAHIGMAGLLTLAGALTACAPGAQAPAAEEDLSEGWRTLGVEYCDGWDNSGDGVIDEGCSPCDMIPTRELDFWRDSSCVVGGEATGEALLPIEVGDRHLLESSEDVEAYLALDPFDPTVASVEHLGQQIAVAKLNVLAFDIGDAGFVDMDGDGEDESLVEILDRAEEIYTTGHPRQKRRMQHLLHRINSSGLEVETWFDPACVAEVEICDLVDNDADGQVDEGCACIEVCDGVDNDEDGIIDNDCPVDCDEPDVDLCWTLSEALSRGELALSNSADGVGVYVSNTGYDSICLDDYLMATSADTQAFLWGDDVTAEGGLMLAPGAEVELYYGSWTTDNGSYDAYLGEHAWWCIESAQYVEGGASFEVFGEVPPDDVLDIVNLDQDYDDDGIEDHVDWQGSYGVATNYNIWDYQAASSVLTIGKSAVVDGDEVHVDLLVRNMGALAGSGTVEDVVPAGWTVVDDGGASNSTLEDGDTQLSWSVSVEGYEDGGLTFNSVPLSYTLVRDVVHDTPRVDLPAATVAYFDGEDDELSRSHPTVAWGFDSDGDGIVTCDL